MSQPASPSPRDEGVTPPPREGAIEPTSVEARQGRQGWPMLWVVGLSTVAAAVILLLLVVFSGVYAPKPTTGLTPKPAGPFATQVHKEQQPSGKVTTTGKPEGQ